MRARKPKTPPAQTGPSPISEIGSFADGSRALEFRTGEAIVQVYAITAADNIAAAEIAERLHLTCSIPPAPPRETAWGDGQFATVEIAPGVRAAVRITPTDDVVLLAPSCALTITATGACLLGQGLQEASRIVGQRRAERDHRRAEKRSPR